MEVTSLIEVRHMMMHLVWFGCWLFLVTSQPTLRLRMKCHSLSRIFCEFEASVNCVEADDGGPWHFRFRQIYWAMVLCWEDLGLQFVPHL